MATDISGYLQVAGEMRVTGLPQSTSSGVRSLYTYALALFALNIPGSFVETGVYKGSSSIAMMRVIQAHHAHKHHYACDSFVGLPSPVAADRDCTTRNTYAKACTEGAQGNYAASREGFETLVQREGLMRHLTVVQGWFNETLPPPGLKQIAFLRLDGDLYESTIWPLRQLYPLVAPGGVIYIDDYGSFAGCARAVRDFFNENSLGDPADTLQPIMEFFKTGIGFESVWFQKPQENATTAAQTLTGVTKPCWKRGVCDLGSPGDKLMRLAASVCATARERDGYDAQYRNQTGQSPSPWNCCGSKCRTDGRFRCCSGVS